MALLSQPPLIPVLVPALVPGITVWRCALSPLAPQSRRQRERAAVEALVSAALGPGASYGHDADGAPVCGSGVPISVSHSRRDAVLAVADPAVAAAVGVDVETTDRRGQLLRVADRFMGLQEWRPEGLLKAWTAKEAAYKCAKTPGLSLTDIVLDDPSNPAVALLPDGRRVRLAFHPGWDGLALAWIDA